MVCLLVTLARPAKWLNQSRGGLGADSRGPKCPYIRWGRDLPTEMAISRDCQAHWKTLGVSAAV